MTTPAPSPEAIEVALTWIPANRRAVVLSELTALREALEGVRAERDELRTLVERVSSSFEGLPLGIEARAVLSRLQPAPAAQRTET